MDIFQGKPQLAQAVFLPHGIGQRVPQQLRQQVKGGLHRISNLPGGQSHSLGVYRHNGSAFFRRYKVRRGHLPPGEGTLHFSPEQILFSLHQHGLDIGIVEIGEHHIPHTVGHVHFKQRHALSDKLPPGFPQYRCPNHRHIMERSPVNRSGFAPILIGTGIQAQKVPHCRRSDLSEQGSPLLSHSLEGFNFHPKQRSHGPAPFSLKIKTQGLLPDRCPAIVPVTGKIGITPRK